MSMTALIKGVCILFILAGIPIALYGTWEIWGTVSLVNTTPKRVKAKFAGYHREVHESSRIRSSPHVRSGGIESSHSVALYPEFTYRADDGSERRVRESKAHVAEIYKPGDEVEILVSPHGFPRLAGFYSLYGRDLLILAIGLGFILLPLVIWKGFIPALESPAGAELAAQGDQRIRDITKTIMELKVGPVPYRYILGGVLGVLSLGLLVSVIAGLVPFLAQMRFGAGGRLIEALEQERFDEAREMVVEGKGIRAKNEHDQNVLLLALEAGQPELARLLIEAGADVNMRSKMNRTPLELATRSGDLETVKMLLAHGALPELPDDEFPVFFVAVAKGHDDIARILIEAGTDLHRRYQIKDLTVTAGDYAALAKKPALAEFIRQRGGSFERPIAQLGRSVKPKSQPPRRVKEKVEEYTSEAKAFRNASIAGACVEGKEAVREPGQRENQEVGRKPNGVKETRDEDITSGTEEKFIEQTPGEVKEIDRDGRFIAHSNGVVVDSQTGLMWAAGDNGKDITWEEAKRYCESCKRAGYTDWRMPTLDELKMLYETGEAYPLECDPSYSVKITRLIKLTCCYPWASETIKVSAASFNFRKSGRRWSPMTRSRNHRALPVRYNQ
jgi:hypothetical protein